MRRISSGLAALLGALGLVGCGTAAYSTTLSVTVADPAGILGGGPIRISIFDPRLGDTRDWADRTLTEIAAGEAASGSVSSVETRLGGGGNPAKEVRAGIYLPGYREFGWYELSLSPKAGEQQIQARFIAWDGYAPQAIGVEPLAALVTARADGKSWRLAVTITLADHLPDEGSAVTVADDLSLSLVRAAAEGNLPEVQRLLIKGAQINGADGEGRTALIAAAYANQVEVARYLVQSGADVNLKDRRGLSSFLISASEVGPDSALLVVMLNAKAKLDAADPLGNTGLHLAAQKSHADILRRLLANGAQVDARNADRRSALHEAAAVQGCTEAAIETVQLLLRGGADPNLASTDGQRPLDLARPGGCAAIITALTAAGAH
jgi:hypothetical protein